jgi:hypothetical protein
MATMMWLIFFVLRLHLRRKSAKSPGDAVLQGMTEILRKFARGARRDLIALIGRIFSN